MAVCAGVTVLVTAENACAVGIAVLAVGDGAGIVSVAAMSGAESFGAADTPGGRCSSLLESAPPFEPFPQPAVKPATHNTSTMAKRDTGCRVTGPFIGIF